MKAGLTKWRVIGISSILFFALFAFLASPKKEKVSPIKEPVEETRLSVLGDLKPTKEDDKKSGKALTFSHRGKAANVEVIATEPGMYPAKSIQSDNQGRVPLSFFDSFKGEFEFLVRQTGENQNRGAFWGPWKFSVSETFPLKVATDLVVRFTNAEGGNIPGAKLRLGRDSVSLLWLEGRTDEEGEALFETLPPGRYVVSGSHQGNTSEMAFVHHGNQKRITLANQPKFTLKGVVKNESGKPIPDAIVECYTDGQDYASDIVTTDLFGQFTAELDAKAGEIVIRHSRFITKSHPFTEDEHVEIKLEEGKDVVVSVKDPNQKPVNGALVSWATKDTPDRIGEAQTSDANGEVTFKGVPEDAVFTAYLGGFQSPETEAVDVKVDLVLAAQNDFKRRIRFRMILASGVQIESIQAMQSSSICKVNATSDRDLEIVGCPEGEFDLKVQTNRGYKNITVELRDGSEVKLGPAQRVGIRFKGVNNEKWGRTKIKIDKKAIQIDLLNGGLAQWRGELYPGRYDIVVANSRIGEALYMLDTTGGSEFSFTLKGPMTKRFWVVDAQGAPVTNAYMMLWKGDTLIDVASSSGQLPTEFRFVDFSEFALIAIDPQRGEGGGMVEGLEDRIVLSKETGTLQVPKQRVDREKIKHELGITFGEKDRGFLIDVDPGSLAEQIGIRDGDFWVSAYFDATKRIQLIVSRKGKFQVTSFDSVLE